jgi:hypothetical protein
MTLADLAQAGHEPTPTTLQPYIVALLEARGPKKRRDLIDMMDEEWRRVSGRNMADSTAKVKKALAVLAEQGVIRQLQIGVWALAKDADGSAQMMPEYLASEPPEPDVEASDSTDPIKSEVEVGSGSQTVYCFYLDAYKNQAAERGES